MKFTVSGRLDEVTLIFDEQATPEYVHEVILPGEGNGTLVCAVLLHNARVVGLKLPRLAAVTPELADAIKALTALPAKTHGRILLAPPADTNTPPRYDDPQALQA